MDQQIRALERGADIVVATPGPRARSHPPARRSSSTACAMLVLDEADEMLDMGFAEDLDAILEATPADAADGALLGDDAAAHRWRLPSGTCTNPARVTIAREKTAAGKVPRVRQVAYIVGARAQAGGARPRARHGGAASRDRVLPDAARGRRRSSRRSTPTATAPRRCTAACSSGSATA